MVCELHAPLCIGSAGRALHGPPRQWTRGVPPTYGNKTWRIRRASSCQTILANNGWMNGQWTPRKRQLHNRLLAFYT